jgi:probable rRNA maturation factor
MLEVEVFGAETHLRRREAAAHGSRGAGSRSYDSRAARKQGDALPAPGEVRRLCITAAAAVGIRDGHLAIEFVDERRICELNSTYRARSEPTDVLSFPVDGAAERAHSARELGDVMICPEHTTDVREAIVHGVLHLAGMDHETDHGEMLALQERVLVDARDR